MERQCAHCPATFEISPDDLQFYDQVSPVFNRQRYALPPPTHCPDCRQQRRLALRNERVYYHRRCSLCSQAVLAVYPEDAPFPVYCSSCYWGDAWNPLTYGVAFDASQLFFDQFQALQRRVPRLHFSSTNTENSDYCNHVNAMKNCYLTVGSMFCEDCLYSTRVFHCRDCVDCWFLEHCELCYECISCDRCYEVCFASDCKDVRQSRYVQRCHGSHNLLFCVNVRQGQYCILNQQFSRDEYERERRKILASPEVLAQYLQQFRELLQQSPAQATVSHLSEDCTGNYITESRNCQHVFDVSQLQDVAYAYDAYESHDCRDIFSFHAGVQCYECYSGALGMHHCLFSSDCWPSDELLYCDHCFGCKHCFGCIGLSKKEYCVLNKQYTPEGYVALVGKIIAHMQRSGEWGEFFPLRVSPFPYNDTAAQDVYPLDKKQAAALGCPWRDTPRESPRADKVVDAHAVPRNIADVPDDILAWALQCEETQRPFKIIAQELDFYRRLRLPVPRWHPDERHRRRCAQKNPRRLWQRACQQCGQIVQTTYQPERPEVIYCDACYLQTVRA